MAVRQRRNFFDVEYFPFCSLAPFISKSMLSPFETTHFDTESFTAACADNGTNKKLSVKWASSDKNIAKVSGGAVTAVSEGTAVITAKIKGYKKTCPFETTHFDTESFTAACADNGTDVTAIRSCAFYRKSKAYFR